MTKTVRFSTLAILGLLVLALSPAAVRQPMAQEPAGDAPPPLSAAGESSAAVIQPEPDWTSSSNPGYAGPVGQPAEPDYEIDDTRSLRVNGSSLKPRDGDVVWASSGPGGCGFASSGNQSTVWNTPVFLPQGSTVSALRMFVNDSSAADCWSWFTVYDLYGNVVDEWGVASDTTAGETSWQVPIPEHVIDYNLFSYALNWRPNDTGSDMQLCGFRLFYTPPAGTAFLPSVKRNYTP